MTQQIRDALAGGALPFKKLHETVGGDDIKLRNLLYNLKQRGIVQIAGDDDRTVSLKGKGKAKAAKPRKAKPAARRAARRKAAPQRPDAQFRQILLDNVVGAGALLRQAVEDHVEIDPDNFALRHALDNHARAEQLYATATRA